MRIRPRAGGVPADLGRPELPGSKSDTQRAMVLAAFGGCVTRLPGALRSDDTEVLAAALGELGAGCAWEPAALQVRPTAALPAHAELWFGENASALRMLLAVVPMLGGAARFDGAAGLRRRPLGAALALLRAGGCAVGGTTLPLHVGGARARWPAVVEVDARTTTQVASGALLGLALRVRRLGVARSRVRAVQPTAPGYLDLTADLLAEAGFSVTRTACDGDLEFEVGDEGRGPAELAVPPDPSAAAFPAVLAALHGRVWAPPPARRAHPDHALAQDVRALVAAGGADVELDAGARPDSFCALAVLAAARAGRTRFHGAGALREKESDRIAAMAAGLRAAGVACSEQPDGLVVTGPLPAREHAIPLPAPADHRVVMALSLLGTLGGGVEVSHPAAVAKSWPGFFHWLARVADVQPA